MAKAALNVGVFEAPPTWVYSACHNFTESLLSSRITILKLCSSYSLLSGVVCIVGQWIIVRGLSLLRHNVILGYVY